ncbi:thiamine biosynthesis protein ThiJ [Ruegeria sp. ANG-S4]|uniref:DJ-1/PfpI family protein n=1 Tax=Ruegeria sp. ANG-S4 TaxID=1577904 RepID=UPI00057D50B3|nr:DJ-1/PfpI family protein [Ruegeria sp. ANG-S4]KIC45900.1 thiamine biosynthesis protein ThiJ [Ruegeria sp. ANG-S4]
MKNIAILIFDGVEELDAVGPYEVFGTAATQKDDVCNVYLVGETMDPVTCILNMKLPPHYTFEDAPKPDILIIPGGPGTRKAQHNEKLIEWVNKTAEGCEMVASVCSGARITLTSGIAKGKRITTHWGVVEELRERGEAAEVLEDVRFVRDGNYISSQGISAGIDMSLWIVGQISDPAYARLVQREIHYDPAPPYAFDV